jgi:hypothetical protein
MPDCRVPLILILWPLVAGGGRGGAQTAPAPGEYEVKAAYLYNFALYTQFEPHDQRDEGSAIISVLGGDPFAAALDRLALSRKVDGKPIVIRRFRAMKDYCPCHILMIPAAPDALAKESQEERLQKALQLTAGQNVLIMTEGRGFLEKGARSTSTWMRPG